MSEQMTFQYMPTRYCTIIHGYTCFPLLSWPYDNITRWQYHLWLLSALCPITSEQTTFQYMARFNCLSCYNRPDDISIHGHTSILPYITILALLVSDTRPDDNTTNVAVSPSPVTPEQMTFQYMATLLYLPNITIHALLFCDTGPDGNTTNGCSQSRVLSCLSRWHFNTWPDYCITIHNRTCLLVCDTWSDDSITSGCSQSHVLSRLCRWHYYTWLHSVVGLSGSCMLECSSVEAVTSVGVVTAGLAVIWPLMSR